MNSRGGLSNWRPILMTSLAFTLGVVPLIGRTFAADEDSIPGARPVAVLGLNPGVRRPFDFGGIRRYLRETQPHIVHTFLLTANDLTPDLTRFQPTPDAPVAGDATVGGGAG